LSHYGVLAAPLPDWLGSTLRNASIPPEAVAVYVREAADGSELINHNGAALFKPASIVKVVTTFAALEVLGESFRWHTPVYITGSLAHGTLNGDIIFKGVGDPSLTYERLQQFLSRLTTRGLRAIHGDVLLDHSYFAQVAPVPEQFYREVENPWNLPPQPLLVNGKLVTLTVWADSTSKQARASITPDLPAVNLESAVNVVDDACGQAQHVIRLHVEGNARHAQIHVSGTLAGRCGPFTKRISVLEPDTYFGGSFRKAFEGLGGTLRGTIRRGNSVAQARLLGTIPSAPLMEVIRETNKHSNNLMARQLFLTAGATLTGQPPSASRSATALVPWLAARVPETGRFVLENGSGLSGVERVSAKGMVDLLDYIRRSAYAAQFLDTLPAVGEDGTMRARLRDDPVAGRSVAKTGTLRDTRAIAGIVVNRYGRAYLFCMIVNHANAAAALKPIDQLIAWLHEIRPAKRPGQ